jgi:hypothetical protein
MLPAVESHLTSITQAIQLAVAPVFLLTAIAGLLNALLGRLARAIDRRRVVEALLDTPGGDPLGILAIEADILARRTVQVLWSIGMSVLSALLVCLTIFAIFLGAFLFVDLSRTVAVLFIAAVVSLTLAMLIFMREVVLAARSVHQSVWPRPPRVDRSQATAEPK